MRMRWALAAIGNMGATIKDRIGNVLLAPVIILLVIVVLPFLALYGAWRFLNGLWLKHRFRSQYASDGKHILFVYSESPNWKEYIEENIVPRIKTKAVFLNWSKRSEWRKNKPLEAKALFHWGGDTEFNPMAIIFVPGWRVKTVRFHQAFRDYKHGKTKLLEKKKEELYSNLDFDHKASS